MSRVSRYHIRQLLNFCSLIMHILQYKVFMQLSFHSQTEITNAAKIWTMQVSKSSRIALIGNDGWGLMSISHLNPLMASKSYTFIKWKLWGTEGYYMLFLWSTLPTLITSISRTTFQSTHNNYAFIYSNRYIIWIIVEGRRFRLRLCWYKYVYLIDK